MHNCASFNLNYLLSEVLLHRLEIRIDVVASKIICLNERQSPRNG